MPSSDIDGLPPAPEVIQLEVGLLENFCEILFCPETLEAAVVDPAFEVDRLWREIEARGLSLRTVLVTHTHPDHIDGVEEMVSRSGAQVAVHPHEADNLPPLTVAPRLVRDREDIAIGRCGVRALETFGHTAGGLCFVADGFVITGDVLFVGGCGRTDFPGGNTAALWNSLQRLMALPEETRVYPGHNYGKTPTSTVGREALENPYLRCADFPAFRHLREKVRKA